MKFNMLDICYLKETNEVVVITQLDEGYNDPRMYRVYCKEHPETAFSGKWFREEQLELKCKVDYNRSFDSLIND